MRVPDSTIRRVASTPSHSGIRTSISTTSGCSRAAASIASTAVGGLADDRQVRLAVDHHAERPSASAPGRRRAGCRSSSARSERSAALTSFGSEVRRRRCTHQPPSGPRPRLQLAPVGGGPLAHPAQSATARRRRPARRPRPAPVSVTSRSTLPPAIAAPGARVAGRPGVLERVGQRLLRDPEHGQLDTARAARGDRRRSRSRPGPPRPAPAASSSSSRSRPGCGANGSAAGSSRSTPSSRRISVSA